MGQLSKALLGSTVGRTNLERLQGGRMRMRALNEVIPTLNYVTRKVYMIGIRPLQLTKTSRPLGTSRKHLRRKPEVRGRVFWRRREESAPLFPATEALKNWCASCFATAKVYRGFQVFIFVAMAFQFSLIIFVCGLCIAGHTCCHDASHLFKSFQDTS